MAEYDCPSCKSWKGCPGKDWYDFRDIRWCVYQIIWMLQNAGELNAGIWPEQIRGHSRQLRAEGYFVKAKIAIGELKARLDCTHNQGELLITQIEDGREIASLSPGAYELLMYVKGKNRKPPDFRAWQRQRRYRDKMHQSGRIKTTESS